MFTIQLIIMSLLLDKGKIMDKRIVYTQDNGIVAVIIPAVSVELALKDVPTGKEYHIVDVAEIPSDRTFRDAWTWE